MAIITLIIDDDPLALDALHRNLTQALGTPVLRASNVQKAWDEYLATLPKGKGGTRWLVVSDMDTKPQEGDALQDGLDLLRKTKSLLEDQCRTILLSGREPLSPLPEWVDLALKKGDPEQMEKIIALHKQLQQQT